MRSAFYSDFSLYCACVCVCVGCFLVCHPRFWECVASAGTWTKISLAGAGPTWANIGPTCPRYLGLSGKAHIGPNCLRPTPNKSFLTKLLRAQHGSTQANIGSDTPKIAQPGPDVVQKNRVPFGPGRGLKGTWTKWSPRA